MIDLLISLINYLQYTATIMLLRQVQIYLVADVLDKVVAYILKPTGIMMKTIAKIRFCYIPKGGSQFSRTNLLSKKWSYLELKVVNSM